jgi:hypothetical protein
MNTFSVQKLQVPHKYLVLVPAIYFSLLGIYDIGSDWVDGKLTWSHTLLNAVFFLPLVLKKKLVYIVCGFCFSLLWLYLLIGSLIEIPETPGITQLEIAAGFLFIGCSLLCSLLLWYTGVQRWECRQITQP